MPIDDQAKRSCSIEYQSAGQLDLKKNVLLNGFDSSTEATTIFNRLIQKK